MSIPGGGVFESGLIGLAWGFCLFVVDERERMVRDWTGLDRKGE